MSFSFNVLARLKFISHQKPGYLFLILCFLIIITSCSGSKEKYKIGILIHSLDVPRYKKEKVHFEEKIKELGGESIVKSANGDEELQYNQAKEMIDAGVDLLIIIPSNANTSAAIVRMAHEKGIKVISYDRLIKNSDLDFYLAFDADKVGEMLAEYTLKKVPRGNYVLLNGDKADESSLQYYNSTMKVLQPYIDAKEINIVFSGFMDDWSGVNAAYYTNKILEFSNEKIDAIVSPYDGLSDGIVAELQKRDMEKNTIVTGQDAEIAACNRILNEQQSMTIYNPVKYLAYNCIEVAFRILKNEKISNLKYTYNGRIDVPSVLLNPIAVDKSNLESTVVADGFLSMEEIMNFKK
ncbi:MAG: substrate-binding domain-containing protein [Bacteroidales bacterium]